MVSSPNLGTQMREYLCGEFRNVAQRMQTNTTDFEVALYWYSGTFGAVQRAVNIEPNVDLFTINAVLQFTHGQLSARLNRQLEDADRPIIITPEIIMGLVGHLNELANRIQNYSDYSDVLEKIARIGYASTGNGFYLRMSNHLEV